MIIIGLQSSSGLAFTQFFHFLHISAYDQLTTFCSCWTLGSHRGKDRLALQSHAEFPLWFLKERVRKHFTWYYKSFPKCPTIQLEKSHIAKYLIFLPADFAELQRLPDAEEHWYFKSPSQEPRCWESRDIRSWTSWLSLPQTFYRNRGGRKHCLVDEVTNISASF